MIEKIKFVISAVKTYKNWHKVILDAFWLLPQGETTVYKLRNGLEFRCRNSSTDLSMVNAMFMRNENVDFVDNLPRNATVLDIGANIGPFALDVIHRNPTARIFCFEPLKSSFAILQENTRKFSRIKCFPVAVSNKKGTSNIQYSSRWEGGATLSKNRAKLVAEATKEATKFEEVKTITLEDVFKDNKIKHCDLLKLDCEGFDHTILKATPSSVLKKIDFIHAEFHTEADRIGIEKILTSNKFEVKSVLFGARNDVYRQYGNIYAQRK